ncbi:Fe2+-dependent dioxygenase [Halopseudomonas nanhaiensis]|uniref:Fe2+-dependent dioxygenase n=1 Tax=Halopseudomonas nanhaiensis TaxID=2830842 RepID=UPI001CBBA484|nr:Fe2+-dependent dioxygenase [Halopseudomonas nanhaiensis]UAW99769.1 Fe2+-dependent dioxygenase [Halopseudomonas nanhaiensis]
MLITLDNVLSKDEVRQFRAHLDRAEWQDGLKTAGTLAAGVKQNQQLDESAGIAIELGNHILRRLGGHPLFISAALPEKIYPPKFNRYSGGGHYGAHVDGAVMPLPGSHGTLRSDLSATLFLCEPEEYDGGELTIETAFGAQQVKLEAGDMVLYPSSSLHRVEPVTRGARVCSFFWIQSMVRDDGKRTLLFDLDQSIQSLTPQQAKGDPDILQLTGVYHNLLRRWAEV